MVCCINSNLFYSLIDPVGLESLTRVMNGTWSYGLYYEAFY